MPTKEGRGPHFLRDGGTGARADVCSDGRLQHSGGQIWVCGKKVLGGKHAHERVAERFQLPVVR